MIPRRPPSPYHRNAGDYERGARDERVRILAAVRAGHERIGRALERASIDPTTRAVIVELLGELLEQVEAG